MGNKRVTIMMDLSLLLFISLVVGTGIFISLDLYPFLNNLISLLITMILLIITYFTGIVPGLTFSLLFSFIQLAYVSYQYVYNKEFSYGSLFWLVIPALYCLSIYLITSYIRKIEEENTQLFQDKIRLGTLDEITQLRTIKMYENDFVILADAATTYHVPLNTCIIRVRYWDSLRTLMTEEQVDELLNLVTKAVEESLETRHFLYMIDTAIPTWGMLIFKETSQLKLFKNNLKEQFQKELLQSKTLSNLTIQLAVSQVQYEEDSEMTGTDFLAEGVNALQYDV